MVKQWANIYLNGFKWLKQKEIYKFDVDSIGKNSSDGYMLKVDLEYPDELHEFRNDYPLAPEKLESSCQVFIVILQINMTQKKVVL